MNGVRDEVNMGALKAKRIIQLNPRNETVSSTSFLTSVNGGLEPSGKEPLTHTAESRILNRILNRRTSQSL